MASPTINPTAPPPRFPPRPPNPLLFKPHEKAIMSEIRQIHLQAADELQQLHDLVVRNAEMGGPPLQFVVQDEIVRHRQFAFDQFVPYGFTEVPAIVAPQHPPAPSSAPIEGPRDPVAGPSAQTDQSTQTDQATQTEPPIMGLEPWTFMRRPSLHAHPFAFPSLVKIYIFPRKFSTFAVATASGVNHLCIVPDMPVADFRFRVAGPESTAPVKVMWRTLASEEGEISEDKEVVLGDDEPSLLGAMARAVAGQEIRVVGVSVID